MKKLLKKLFLFEIQDTDLTEGVYAHQYQDESIKKQIREKYDKNYKSEETPLTNPLKFDPLNPPNGWAYDPYYELWVKIK